MQAGSNYPKAFLLYYKYFTMDTLKNVCHVFYCIKSWLFNSILLIIYIFFHTCSPSQSTLSTRHRIHWLYPQQRPINSHQRCVLVLTMNCIKWWGYSFGDLRGVWSSPSFPLLSDSLWLGVVVPVRIPPMGQIDLLENHLYLKRLCTKSTFKKQQHKKVNRNIQ